MAVAMIVFTWCGSAKVASRFLSVLVNHVTVSLSQRPNHRIFQRPQSKCTASRSSTLPTLQKHLLWAMATPSGLRECANAKKPKLLADLFHDTLKDVYAAVKATLIMTAKLNDVDPQAWLADVLARIASIPQGRLHELLPWEWQKANELKEAAA